jgi:hypothetical protein
MRRRSALKLLGSAAGAGMFATTVSADDSLPREETKRFYTHQEVQELLDDFKQRARRPFELEEIGESVEGRELTVARVGSGDTDVFFVSEQHGDEPTGTNALLAELRELATSGSPFARTVTEELTVHVLPMQNPDGAMRNQRENARPEDYTWEDPFEGTQSGPADPNRQHYYKLPEEELPGPKPDENPSPETQAMLEYALDLEPLWISDLHTQSGMYYDEDENPGDMFHSSNFWPSADAAGTDSIELSQQLNVSMYDHAEGKANAQLSVYPGGDTVNIARNAYGAYGFGSILNEMTGQTGDRGERMEGQMVRIMRNENRAILEETADGTLFERDPDRVEEIPDRPDFGEAGDWPWEATTE